LSTHPSHDTRMEELDAGMEQSVEIYRQARAAGP
ncbi:MAG: M48 family peptidase, partial [Gammaproteobacteria bacterium]|nr:M48 family peptidase [Gammaproteobacteria bacterium]